jgi:2-polyprenyl-3-methyl-5-hydroxy-6-metoxy-1,4-benzoquinol methylase
MKKNIFKKFYSNYHSTHEVSRSGKDVLTSKTFNLYNGRYGKFIPAKLDSHILDLGCGSGRLLRWLELKGYKNLIGVEASEEQIKIAKKLTRAEIIHSDILEFKINAFEYDLILLIDVLEHLDKEAAVQILENLRNGLKQNGSILIQVPNNASPFGIKIQNSDITHLTAYTESSLRQVLGISGFNQVKIYPWNIIVSDVKSLLRWAALSVIHGFISIIFFIDSGRKEIATSNLIAVVKKD